MTIVEMTRGGLRAALASVLPHTGKASDDTPLLGRMRIQVEDSVMWVWAADYPSAVVVQISDLDNIDGELDVFDLPADSVRAILAVFRAPSGERRQWWNDEPMRLEVTRDNVVLTETGGLVDGQSLRVPRIVADPQQDDRYPDVPRDIRRALAAPRITRGFVPMAALGRFLAAAKGYSLHGALHVQPREGYLVVRSGRDLVGIVHTSDEPHDYVLERDTEHHSVLGDWSGVLEPLQRPEPVHVPESVVDDLRDQIADLARAGVTITTGLHVVRGGDDA